jgi:hypothetical protein
MPGHRNPLRMAGFLTHLEDAAAKISSRASQSRGTTRAGAMVDTVTDKARAFAAEKGLEMRYIDLTIQFIGANGLPVMDVGATADPYFHAEIDGRKTFV